MSPTTLNAFQNPTTANNSALLLDLRQQSPELFDTLYQLNSNIDTKLQKLSPAVKSLLDSLPSKIDSIKEFIVVNNNGSDAQFIRSQAYQILKSYLDLTDADRKTISDSFPFLVNVVNNKELLEAATKVKSTSGTADFKNLKTTFLKLLVEGKLYAPNNVTNTS
uniref:Fatty-acid and retinol-binding protein 1 n=1 Tax=Rhabditophanes sp. KR3021 TaxID=114890 RepID=A0AC35U036_9BILA